MRVKRITQRSFQAAFSKSRRGREMAAMSLLLDEVPEILDLVHRDLTSVASAGAGRQGMTAEQVFRCAGIQVFSVSDSGG